LAFDVAALLDWRAIPPPERLSVAEETRQEEVVQRPQLAEMVLERRARQAQPLPGPQHPRQLRGGGQRVLDGLRLVQHDHVPVLRRQHRMIACSNG
jgi:hypothetical protein